MKKLGIAFIFFTLCILTSSASFGQVNRGFLSDGSITVNGGTLHNHGNVTINGDTYDGEVNILTDSTLKRLKRLHPSESNSSKHYLSKNGENYYMEIVPPDMKGKKVDHSNIWLLGNDVAQTCH